MKFILLALLAVPLSAQTCSTHIRQAKKPWTWLSSNICPADYDAWLAAHPPHPWYKDKYFWGGVAIIGAAVAADYASTSHAQQWGNAYVEQDPLLGDHPSNARIAGIGSLAFGSYFGLHLLEYKYSHKDPSEAWRQFGRWSVPAVAASIHGPAAYHNYGLPTPKPLTNGLLYP